MKLGLKWLLPALGITELALVQSGLLDLTAAAYVAIGLEALALVIAGRYVFFAVKRYRRNRAQGLDVWAALEGGFAQLFPGPVARMAAAEMRLWTCLAKWILQRGRSGEGKFSYHKRSILGTMLVLVLFTTPAEIMLFEIIIPWGWLRLVLLIACIYALFWMFGLYASMLTLPHQLGAEQIQLYYGILASGQIPYSEIISVERNEGFAPRGRGGLRLIPGKEEAYFAVGGRTNITLHLQTARSLQGFLRPAPPVKMIHLAADNPEKFVRDLQARLGISED